MNGLNIIKILKDGGIGVLPTDTLYGLVGLALNKNTVKRIYKVRQRNPKKPLIILISSLKDLAIFNIKLDSSLKKALNKFWPGKVSVILPCISKKLKYLHRGAKTLAFRFPSKKSLINLLGKTGPLVAPSANWEGQPPAKNIKEAKRFFGDEVDFYVNAGKLDSLPSTLIKIESGKVSLLRKGAVKLKNEQIFKG